MRTSIDRIQFLTILLVLFATAGHAQMQRYDSIVRIANHLYEARDFRNAVTQYQTAFNTINGKAVVDDRYMAAKACALSGQMDSVFPYLYRLLDKTDFLECPKLVRDADFNPIKKDRRWLELLNRLNPDHEVYNDSLALLLSAIRYEDQHYREQVDSVSHRFGNQSAEMKALWAVITAHDDTNLIKITAIIDMYGWLSPNQVGKKGNQTLWLVIQHAPLAIQEKYLPMMQRAVADGKASKRDLAYLIDRVLVRNGKKQLYGTQYTTKFDTNKTTLDEVEDPANLNTRRISMGLSEMPLNK